MNSKQLKRENTQVYQDFFNSYNLVVSAPMLSRYPGTGLFKQKNSYFTCEKYPLRNYIGIGKISEQKNDEDIGPFLTFKKNAETPFITDVISKHYPISHSLLRQMGFDTQMGYLSEYHWSDIPSIVSITSIGDLLYKGILSVSDIERLNIDTGDYSLVLQTILNHDQKFLKNFGFLGDLRNNSDFIGCSALTSSSHSINTNGITFQNMGVRYHFPDSGLSSFVLHPNIFTKPFFQSDSIFRHENEIKNIAHDSSLILPEIGFFESIEAIGNHLSLEIFGRLKECYEGKEFERFFQASKLFNKLRLGIFRDALDRHIDVEGIWEILKKYANNDSSGCAVQAGRRIQVFGNLDLDITPAAIQELRETFGLPFTLDYSSHKDGWESKGVKIEQWVSQGINSEFTHSYEVVHVVDNLLSVSMTKDTDYDNLKLYMKGLFIDAVKEQIYIQGKLLTSQEIKSKTMTIILISLILDSPDKRVHSSRIPASSYSKNPSEMSSKIITPLRQLFQQYFNLNFPITLDDNGQGFNIQLHTCSIPITILRKRNI